MHGYGTSSLRLSEQLLGSYCRYSILLMNTTVLRGGFYWLGMNSDATGTIYRTKYYRVPVEKEAHQ